MSTDTAADHDVYESQDLVVNPVRVGWLGDALPANWRSLDSALRVLGASLDGERQDEESVALVGTFDDLESLSESRLERLRAALRHTPILVFPKQIGGRPSVSALAALRRLSGDEELSFGDPSLERASAFGGSDVLRPFAGVSLDEREPRLVAPLVHCPTATPLITNPRGVTFARFPTGLHISVIPQLEESVGLLKEEFGPGRFLGVLPLLVFGRQALGRKAWASPEPRAAFMVDDPNFRRANYGFMKYRDLIDASKKHGFHTAIAMIPIDWRKSSRQVSELIRRNEQYMSIVIHGVDHLSEEFTARTSMRQAESTIAEGLARMAAHERTTGLRFARAMTFPHGVCNATWMEAVRNNGLEAAITDWARPIERQASIDDPLYEMHPAEMSFLGFPLINRFPAEGAKEELLFKAFLGKPLIVYTHHGFFRGGLDPLVSLAEFLNRHVSPRWSSVEEIVHANYQLRESGSGLAMRVFSNRVTAEASSGRDFDLVVKGGFDEPYGEICRINGTVVRARVVSDGGGALFQFSPSPRVDVAFRPPHQIPVPDPPGRPRLRGRIRRLATEFRDQIVHPLFRATWFLPTTCLV